MTPHQTQTAVQNPAAPTVITRWHDIVKSKNAKLLADLIADDAVFYSPVVHTAQQGKAITLQYLAAAIHVFGVDSFSYVREIIGQNDAVLEFELTLEGVIINGVDIISWNDAQQITSFKVMLRPLKGVQKIHEQMGLMLQQLKP